jgi:hypothetical protein
MFRTKGLTLKKEENTPAKCPYLVSTIVEILDSRPLISEPG